MTNDRQEMRSLVSTSGYARTGYIVSGDMKTMVPYSKPNTKDIQAIADTLSSFTELRDGMCSEIIELPDPINHGSFVYDSKGIRRGILSLYSSFSHNQVTGGFSLITECKYYDNEATLLDTMQLINSNRSIYTYTDRSLILPNSLSGFSVILSNTAEGDVWVKQGSDLRVEMISVIGMQDDHGGSLAMSVYDLDYVGIIQEIMANKEVKDEHKYLDINVLGLSATGDNKYIYLVVSLVKRNTKYITAIDDESSGLYLVRYKYIIDKDTNVGSYVMHGVTSLTRIKSLDYTTDDSRVVTNVQIVVKDISNSQIAYVLTSRRISGKKTENSLLGAVLDICVYRSNDKPLTGTTIIADSIQLDVDDGKMPLELPYLTVSKTGIVGIGCVYAGSVKLYKPTKSVLGVLHGILTYSEHRSFVVEPVVDSKLISNVSKNSSYGCGIDISDDGATLMVRDISIRASTDIAGEGIDPIITVGAIYAYDISKYTSDEDDEFDPTRLLKTGIDKPNVEDMELIDAVQEGKYGIADLSSDDLVEAVDDDQDTIIESLTDTMFNYRRVDDGYIAPIDTDIDDSTYKPKELDEILVEELSRLNATTEDDSGAQATKQLLAMLSDVSIGEITIDEITIETSKGVTKTTMSKVVITDIGR